MVEVVVADVEVIDPDIALVAAGLLVEHVFVSGVGKVDNKLGVRSGALGFCVAVVELNHWWFDRVFFHHLLYVLLRVGREDDLVVFVDDVALGRVLPTFEFMPKFAFGEEFDLGIASHV